jgi:hypothetical protein
MRQPGDWPAITYQGSGDRVPNTTASGFLATDIAPRGILDVRTQHNLPSHWGRDMKEQRGNPAPAALAVVMMCIAVGVIGCNEPSRQVPSPSEVASTIPNGPRANVPPNAPPAPPPNAPPASPNQLDRVPNQPDGVLKQPDRNLKQPDRNLKQPDRNLKQPDRNLKQPDRNPNQLNRGGDVLPPRPRVTPNASAGGNSGGHQQTPNLPGPNHPNFPRPDHGGSKGDGSRGHSEDRQEQKAR